MDSGFDSLELLLKESNGDIKISNNYNEKLLFKLHEEPVSVLNNFDRTVGLSFLMAGFVFIFINYLGIYGECLEFIYGMKNYMSIIINNLRL